MRRARPNSLLVPLLLTVQLGLSAQASGQLSVGQGSTSGPATTTDEGSGTTPAAALTGAPAPDPARRRVAAPDLGPVDPEEATRRKVGESEHLRAMQSEAQRAATEQAAQALADEKRLGAEQFDAFERLKAAEAAVDEMRRHIADLNRHRAETQRENSSGAASRGDNQL